jgi:hypothetical protein
MVPILLPLASANHRFPSGPVVIPWGALPAAKANSVKRPVAGLKSPISGPLVWVNQIMPLGPTVTPHGLLPKGMAYSTMAPVVAFFSAILLVVTSVNQTLPLESVVIPPGPLLGDGSGNSVIVADMRQRSSRASRPSRTERSPRLARLDGRVERVPKPFCNLDTKRRSPLSAVFMEVISLK